MNINENMDCVFVIFGGTGDLTHRKLIPAIYNLMFNDKLPDNFALVSVGRRDMSDDEYRNKLMDSIKKYSRNEFDDSIWNSLASRIYYEKFNFNDDEGYVRLGLKLKNLDKNYNTNGNRVYYLAVAPEYFGIITEKLHSHNLADNINAWQRVVIEKPFGRDLESAEYLNKQITDVFTEKNTYRIDHYLGKEMIQSIMVLRFANAIFEPLWNSRYIDNIQISSSETVGVENRGGYYEEAGALKDMVQNHMLQLLTLIAMEPPVSLNTSSIRDEKVKVLRSLEEFTPELVKKNIVRGQYSSGMLRDKSVPAYREEERVSNTSQVETFIALKAQVQNFRWSGVPFYIRTGKRMQKKSTEIIVQFKSLPEVLYFKEYGTLEPNLLVIRIQPREGAFFQFNTKEPGTVNNIIPVQMDFCQNCKFDSNSPEAYEKLLFDVMNGDPTLFTSWDEVEYSWRFVDTISKVWKSEDVPLSFYESGSWGPKDADELISRDGNKWWNI